MLRRVCVLLATFACCGFLAIGCSDDTPAEGGGGTDTGTTGDTGTTDMGGGDTGMEDTGIEDTGTTSDTGGEEDTGGIPDNGIVYAGCVLDPSECDDDQECRGGICVDEITSADDYITAAADRLSSYWWTIQFPSEFEDLEDSSCCFDYTNDGNPDNQLGFILSILGGFLGGEGESVQDMVDGAFEDGDIVILTDWLTYPESGTGEADFAILIGDLEKDGEGNPVESFGTRAAGDGNYTVQPMSLDGYGPQVRFGLADVDDNTMTTELSIFNLTLSLGEIDGINIGDLNLTLDAAKIEADLSVETNGIHTVDREAAGETPFMGGGMLGGVVGLEGVLGIFEDLAADCECTTEGEPLMVYAYDFASGSLQLECNAASGATECGESEPGVCGFLGIVCGVTSIIAGVPDVDLYACEEVVPSGGTEQYRCGVEGAEFAEDEGGPLNACNCVNGVDGIADSVSIGLYFAAAGAAITGLVPDEE